MNNDLHAKALRAAKWLNNQMVFVAKENPSGWLITRQTETLYYPIKVNSDLTDRMFIAFCEDRGWIDTAEDEGVEWENRVEWCTVGEYVAHVYDQRTTKGGYGWIIDPHKIDAPNAVSQGREDTRAEARKAALEAVRRLG